MKPLELNIQLFASVQKTANLPTSSIGNKATITAIATEGNADLEKNTSFVTTTAIIEMKTGSFSGVSSPKLITIWHDNKTNEDIVVSTLSVTAINKRGKKEVSGTIEVEHNDDGTASGYAIAKWDYQGTFNVVPKSGSVNTGELKLKTIPRASSISATDADIGSVSNINIYKASNTFVTTLKYEFLGLKGTIAEKIDRDNYGWNIPTSFYSKIPNTPSASCKIIADTYNNNVLLGSKETTIKVTANKNLCLPNLVASIADANQATINLTGNNKVIVLNASNMLVNYNVSAKNSASIKRLTLNNISLPLSTNQFVINKPISKEFTFKATDSREYSKELILKPSTIDYFVPSIKASFKRVSPVNGQIKVSYDGKWFNGSFGKATNTLEIYYRYKISGTDAYSRYLKLNPIIEASSFKQETILVDENGRNDTFDYRNAYDLQIKVIDKLNVVEPTSSKVYKGIPIAHWGKDNFSIEGKLFVEGKEIKPYEIPVGSPFFTEINKSPEEILGYGNWERFAEGRVIVGFDSNDADFNQALKTGGSKELQKHSHTGSVGEAGQHSHSIGGEKSTLPKGSTYARPRGYSSGVLETTYDTSEAGQHTHELTINETGEGLSGNLQPFVVLYCWIRKS